MKVTEHVEHLLRQGKKPKELTELGFPKQVVTRVRRQLKKEKIASQLKGQKGKAGAESHLQSSATLSSQAEPHQVKLSFLASKVQELEERVQAVEALQVDLEELQNCLDGTPALGLKHCFKCHCGASGFVALHIKCTKCGRETWRGWFPKE